MKNSGKGQERGTVSQYIENLGCSNKLQHSSENVFSRKLSLQCPNLADSAGRNSELFKSGGGNVYPREIEDMLESHDSVLFAAVIGVEDEIFQEVGWGFVMLLSGKTVSEQELLELAKSKLANYKVPKRFFVRELLPLLGNGKIDKLSLNREIKETLMK